MLRKRRPKFPVRKLSVVRSANLVPRYLVFGKSYPLLRYISSQTGLKAVLESLMFPVMRLFSFVEEVTDSSIDDGWRDLGGCVKGIEAACFLNTGFYKTTLFVGMVKASGSIYFVKCFKDELSYLECVKSSRQFLEIAPPYFYAASIIVNRNRIIVYKFIRAASRNLDLVALERLCKNWCLESILKAPNLRLEADEYFRIADLLLNANEFGCPQLVIIVQSALQRLPESIPIALGHGDFTVWNCLLCEDGRVAVIDYESVGYYSFCYDYLHLKYQAQALKGAPIVLDITHVARELNVDLTAALDFLLFYFLHQLSLHLTAAVRLKQRHFQLRNMIQSKMGAIEEVLMVRAQND